MTMLCRTRVTVLCLLATLTAAPALADSGAAHRAAQTVPVKLGTSGGNVKDISKAFCCSGTLGALVTKNGKSYILSNNHVLARSGAAVVGENVSQPGLIDSGCRPKTIVAGFSEAASLGGSNVDAALAEVRPGSVDAAGVILDVGIPANAPGSPAVGMTVAKSGRTTGLTCGDVSSVLTDVSVQYQKGCNSGKKFVITYVDQMIVGSSTFSAGGDSGSLIVNASTAQPVALLYAGSSSTTIANPIQDVTAALGVSFVGGTTHTVSCPAAAATATASANTPPAQAIEHAAVVKNRHAPGLLRQPGVQGVGVGVSDNDSSQPAIVLYVIEGVEHAPLPTQLDGIPTRIVSTDRFRASGWNEPSESSCSH